MVFEEDRLPWDTIEGKEITRGYRSSRVCQSRNM